MKRIKEEIIVILEEKKHQNCMIPSRTYNSDKYLMILSSLFLKVLMYILYNLEVILLFKSIIKNKY